MTSRQTARPLVIYSLVCVALLGTLAYALFASRARAREELEARLEQRTELAAALIDSTLRQTVSSAAEAAGSDLRGDHPVAALRNIANGAPGIEAALLSTEGRVIARSSREPVPALLDPGALKRILRGQPVLRTRAAREVQVAMLAPVRVGDGLRVLQVTYPAGLLQAFLGGYLAQIAHGDAAASVLDRRTGVVLSRSGTTESTELRRASADVGDSGWAVVLDVPAASLYGPIDGGARWLPVALLIGLGGAATFSLLLLRRLLRLTHRLALANTDLEARTAEAIAATEMKSTFLATMSHELRTPLNGIVGFAELMHDGHAGPISGTQREYLGDILASSEHLRELIDDVLDHSKIDAGRIDLRPAPVHLDDLVAETCASVAALADSRDITLEQDVPTDLPTISTDPGRLRQILLNYLSNALKFTRDRGHVVVRVSLDDDRFVLVVDDDGPGVPVEDRTRMWAPFEQLQTGSARGFGGTGLGLSLVKKIAEAQGGSVGIEDSPAGGARFWVELPAHLVATAEPELATT